MDTPHIFSVTEENLESCISENEKAVAGWVLKNNKRAGATTGTFNTKMQFLFFVQRQESVWGFLNSDGGNTS